MEGQPSSLVFLQYLTTVFDNIADGILLIAVLPSGRYKLVLANKPFFVFTGYPEDSVGKEVSKFVSAETYTFLSRHYQKVIRTKKTVDYTRWTEVPAGLRAFDVRMVPIFDTTGNCVQIASIIGDVTEREQLRQEVEHLRGTVRGIRNSV